MWADSIGMMSWTNCIGSERNRSIGGQHPPRTSSIDFGPFDSVNFPSRESTPRSISRVFSFFFLVGVQWISAYYKIKQNKKRTVRGRKEKVIGESSWRFRLLFPYRHKLPRKPFFSFSFFTVRVILWFYFWDCLKIFFTLRIAFLLLLLF